MTCARPRRGDESGATAVEFALVMIPLLVLVFGLVQYSLYFWAMQGGSDIARNAARTASVGNPADCATFRSGVAAQIDKLASSGSAATIKRSYTQQSPSEVQVGDTVTVSVQFRSVDLHFPFIPFINGGTITSSAESRVDFVPSQPETCS
ncbi:MAG: TadE/TadG family type IV pilus assembly protein [Marmoricola sp.]